MKKSSPYVVIITFLLLFATWAYTKNFSQIPERKLERPLSELPAALENFRSKDIELSQDVWKILGATDMVLRKYTSNVGDNVSVFVSYHNKQTSRAHPHSPRICLPSSGYSRSKQYVKSTTLADGRDIPAVWSEYVMEGEKTVFLYWYQTGRRYMTNEYAQKISMITDAIFRRRTDIAFVRLTTDVDQGGVAAAERRLENFVKIFVPVLNRFLPE